jgi:hypothetical protein
MFSRPRRYMRLEGVRLRSLLLALALAGAAGAAFDASSAPAEGQPTDTAKFSCSAVTYAFTGFPDASENSVVEVVKLDDVRVSTTTFKFNGPSGSNVVPISPSPGHHEIDADAFWNTNGVKGTKDIPGHDGITCAPVLTRIDPESGTTAGGTEVMIEGSGFTAPASVTIGIKAYDVRVVNEGEITAITSPHAAGSEQVVVSDDNGESTIGPSYTYTTPPTVTSIDPTSGTSQGGTTVTIEGSGFVAPATVTIGGETLAPTVVNEGEITAVTTKHLVGPAEVVVVDAKGRSTEGPSYRYVNPPPKVTSIDPESGSTEGGTTVKIEGSGFVAPATVTIGGEPHEAKVENEGEISYTTSAHEAGPQEVIVSDANGTSSGGPDYTFLAPSTVMSTTPGAGTTAGGLSFTPESSGGAGTGSSGVLSTKTSAPPPPVLGVSGNVAPVSGTVLVLLPGASKFVPLTGLRHVPFGTIINALHGKVRVTTAGPHGGTQTIVYYGGIFRLTQSHSGLVTATLVYGNFGVCPTARERSHLARVSSKRASRKHVVRKLWSEGHGSFSTNGAYAAGAVLGTRWLVEDMCDGTLVKVATDRVKVTNLVNHKRITVKAGHSYVAAAP